MFQINNNQYRSLQEQVSKNMEDIKAHYEMERVIADFGITVIGQKQTEQALPAVPPTGEEAYGAAYAVGIQPPYKFYIWTRPNDEHPTGWWLNIGYLAIVGEQGPDGDSIDKAELNPDTHELILTLSDGRVINVEGSLKGDKGESPIINLSSTNEGVTITTKNPGGDTSTVTVKNGINGASVQGPPGPPSTFNIMGVRDTAPTYPGNYNMGDAFLVSNGTHYDLWIIVKNTAGNQVWQNTGQLSAGTYIYSDGVPITSWDTNSVVKKSTDSGANRIYGIDSSAKEKTYTLRPDPQIGNAGNTYKNQPVQYDITSGKNNGLIQIAETPIENYHTASKAYVDKTNKLYKHYNSLVINDYIVYFYVVDRINNWDNADVPIIEQGVMIPATGYKLNDPTKIVVAIRTYPDYVDIFTSDGETESIDTSFITYSSTTNIHL